MRRPGVREETARAAFYEQHRDDPAIWGEPIEAPIDAQGGGLGTTITVRFSAREAARIRAVAEAQHLTYSDIVRRAVRHYTDPAARIELVIDDEAGTSVDSDERRLLQIQRLYSEEARILTLV